MGSTGLVRESPRRASVVRLMTHVGGWDGSRRADPASRWLLWLAIVVGIGAGAAATIGPLNAMAGLAVLLLIAAVCRWPALAAYLIVVVTPLTVGIKTGASLPLRPNEVLDALVGVGLAAGGFARLRTGRVPRLRLGSVEWSMLLMAVCNSALPLLVMMIRQQQISQDDLLYALVMWKLLGLYVIVRLSIRTDRQIRVCLWLSVAAASVVAVVAIAQSLHLFGIAGLVTHYFAQKQSGPVTAGARASSTLGLPAATADLMIFNLAIVSGLLVRYRRHRLILAIAAALFVFAAVAAGEISGYIGLIVGVVLIAIVTRSTRPLAVFIVAGLAGAGLLRAVIGTRLSGFQSPYRVPNSWLGRLSNLRSYFFPKLFSDWNFVFGVRPAARIPILTQNPGYVWIESGYAWLLWGGGIPFVASYVFFVVAAAKRGWRAARDSTGASSVAGAAAFVAVLVTTVLMLFDPHLTYRGSADALFALLALAVPRPAPPRAADPGGMPETSRTAWQGGSIVAPEDETRTTSGALADRRSAFSPNGNARGSSGHAGSLAGPDGWAPGVNPAGSGPNARAPGHLPRFLRAHLAGIVAIALAVTAGAALLAGSQTREYKSQAVVVVYPSPSEAGTGIQAAVMGTEQAIATSGVVAGIASNRVNVPEAQLRTGLSVSVPANSYLLNISCANPDPHVAQRSAQAIAESYVAYRTLPHVPTPNQSGSTAVAPVGSVEPVVVTAASLPAAPASPNVALDTGAGLVLGIILGLGFALVRDRVDDRLRSRGDLEAESGARLLAAIPPVEDGVDGGGPVMVRSPGSAAADAFRDLRTRIVQAAAWQDARTILVASPEGADEALVAGNLAAALALAGQHVVLVCADPRRARTQEQFGVAASTGLTGVLNGDASLATAIRRTDLPTLEILPAGPDSNGSASVIRASELRSILRGIRDGADFIIIDGPGILTAPEASVLAELADMVLLTADAGKATRTGVRAAARELQQVHLVIDGCVLTGLGPGRHISPRRSLRLGAWRFPMAVSRAAAKVPPPARRPERAGQQLRRGAWRFAMAVSRVAAKVPPPARWPALVRQVRHSDRGRTDDDR